CYAVPITPLCPVAGLVGVCSECREWFRPEMFSGSEHFAGYRFDPARGGLRPLYKTWAPPPMRCPAPGEPLYLLVRGFCDEERLGRLVGDTWGRIPDADRQPMRERLGWCPEKYYPTFLQGALRIEALPNWPEREGDLGMCLNSGRAIRLHSPTVAAMPDGVLATLIAHELGHVYQYASERSLTSEKPIEEDVIDVMTSWGFRDADIDEWQA